MFNIQIGMDKLGWSKQDVEKKLEALGQLAGKEVSWIRSDLSTVNSSSISRWIWTFVAKHFTWLRERIYGVNLEKSKSALQQIGEQISKDDADFIKLYNLAIEKFNAIAPRHNIVLVLAAPAVVDASLSPMAEHQPVDDVAPPPLEESQMDVQPEAKDEIKVIEEVAQKSENQDPAKVVTEGEPSDFVPANAEAANQFLIESLIKGDSLDLKDILKFQNANQLDLKSAKFPLSKHTLDNVFAHCPGLKKVVLPGTIDAEAIGTGDSELTAFETVKYLFDQPNNRLFFEFADFSASNYAMVVSKLNDNARNYLFEVIIYHHVSDQLPFLYETIKLMKINDKLTDRTLFGVMKPFLENLNYYQLSEIFKKFTEADLETMIPVLQKTFEWKKVFNSLFFDNFSYQYLIFIIKLLEKINQNDLFTIIGNSKKSCFFKMISEDFDRRLMDEIHSHRVNQGFDDHVAEDISKVYPDYLSYVGQIMEILKNEETDKREKISFILDITKLGERDNKLIASLLGLICATESVLSFLINNFTELNGSPKFHFYDLMRGILESGDDDIIRLAFKRYYLLPKQPFEYLVKNCIDTKQKLQAAIDTLPEELLMHERQAFIRTLCDEYPGNVDQGEYHEFIQEIFDAQQGLNKEAFEAIKPRLDCFRD